MQYTSLGAPAHATKSLAPLGFAGGHGVQASADHIDDTQSDQARAGKCEHHIQPGAQVGRDNKEIPVSVKTRVGYNKDELENWLPILLREEPAVITVHARTRKEMSKVPAQWERIARAVGIRNEMGSETLIIGNGDVLSVEDAYTKCEVTGADGAMLGRAIFGNPWLFHPKNDLSNVTLEERFRVMIEHTRLFEELLSFKNFAIMKKHYKAYVNGFPGAHELRATLMEAKSSNEIEAVVNTFLASHLELHNVTSDTI